jgi:hypothetical protein
MKQITILLILSFLLLSLFVYCEDKSTEPPISDKPGYYYPRNTGYGWRYIDLIKPGCYEIKDSFDYKIIGTNVRDGRAGYDRIRVYKEVSQADTYFIYQEGNAIFEKNVPDGTPILEVLAGPIKAGTSWEDVSWDCSILGLEDVTLTISGETYKGCAKIVKRPRSPAPSKPDRIYEWWAPQFGKVREEERDANGVCQKAKELRCFTKTGQFP